MQRKGNTAAAATAAAAPVPGNWPTQDKRPIQDIIADHFDAVLFGLRGGVFGHKYKEPAAKQS